MAKIMLIICAALAIQACIHAAPNDDVHSIEAVGETPDIDPKLDNQPYGVSEDTQFNDDKSFQGQRQKRFNDFLNFGFSSSGPYNPNIIRRYDSSNTGEYDATITPLSQVLRRVQIILGYTRQQALTPVAQYPFSFIPIIYIPRRDCDCTPVETPGNDDESSNARPTQPTTATPPTASTTQAITPAIVVGPSNNDTNTTKVDLSSRSPDIDDVGDGSRPISFVPVKPKTPLSRPPPPVEHGSSQASRGDAVEELASANSPPVPTGLPAQPQLPTNSIPTLCDAAILTCCLRSEVTYNCFKSQGCPNPSSSKNPCNPNIVLKVINKFQFYYANRQG